ncbi:MAG: hypothetical protein ABI947_08060 [Chloroflexota bacterium]
MGIDTLTPTTLVSHVAPYLQALIDLQQVIAQLQGIESPQAKIRLISQNSPVGIDVEGIESAYKFAEERIVPWRRKHAEKLAGLEISALELDIEQKRAVVADTRVKTQDAHIEAKSSEAQRNLDLEKSRLEIVKLNLEIDKARVELITDLFDKYGPKDLPEQDRLAYVIRLIGPLKILAESPLELQSGKPN